MNEARCGNERLRRDAAGPEAVASELLALDQRNLAPEARTAGRGHQSGGAAADDHDVEWFGHHFTSYPAAINASRIGPGLSVVMVSTPRRTMSRAIDGSSTVQTTARSFSSTRRVMSDGGTAKLGSIPVRPYCFTSAIRSSMTSVFVTVRKPGPSS